jgi:hypothetical protein
MVFFHEFMLSFEVQRYLMQMGQHFTHMLVILEITKYFSIYHNYGGSFRFYFFNVMNFIFFIENFRIMLTKKTKLDEGSF